MKLAAVASMTSEDCRQIDPSHADDVVEIGILLPAKRAVDLIELARGRRESVGQMIRRLIDRELMLVRAAN